jgi:hypothetical protein
VAIVSLNSEDGILDKDNKTFIPLGFKNELISEFHQYT